MIGVIIDTNILVSALLKPISVPSKVLQTVFQNGNFNIYVSMAILVEYQRVLSYPKFGKIITSNDVRKIIAMFQETAKIKKPPTTTFPIPHEEDRAFYDIAQATGAYVITGNHNHFPPTNPKFISPQKFLEFLG